MKFAVIYSDDSGDLRKEIFNERDDAYEFIEASNHKSFIVPIEDDTLIEDHT